MPLVMHTWIFPVQLYPRSVTWLTFHQRSQFLSQILLRLCDSNLVWLQEQGNNTTLEKLNTQNTAAWKYSAHWVTNDDPGFRNITKYKLTFAFNKLMKNARFSSSSTSDHQKLKKEIWKRTLIWNIYSMLKRLTATERSNGPTQSQHKLSFTIGLWHDFWMYLNPNLNVSESRIEETQETQNVGLCKFSQSSLSLLGMYSRGGGGGTSFKKTILKFLYRWTSILLKKFLYILF